MERKLIKQGDNALTVTLPAKWLKQQGLEAGDIIQMQEENNSILIHTPKTAAAQEIHVDVTSLERSAVFQKILALYIEGYDKITIKHNNPLLINDVAKELIGIVIEKQTSDVSVFKNLIVVADENLVNIISRIRFMLLEQANTLVKIAAGEKLLNRLKAEEKLLDYNILYCLRFISKYERSTQAYRYFAQCLVFDLIADQLTEIGQYINGNIKLATSICDAIENYVHLALRGDLKNINQQLRQFRNSIGTKTFAEGLSYSLAETMYNFVGYLVERKEKS